MKLKLASRFLPLQKLRLLVSPVLVFSQKKPATFDNLQFLVQTMEDRKQETQSGGGWMSVPAFGDWDMKNGVPDYSVDFSKIREMRKQNKSDFSRASIGNEEEILHKAPNAGGGEGRDNYTQLPDNSIDTAPAHSPTARKKIASYFVCCIGA